MRAAPTQVAIQVMQQSWLSGMYWENALKPEGLKVKVPECNSQQANSGGSAPRSCGPRPEVIAETYSLCLHKKSRYTCLRFTASGSTATFDAGQR